MKTSRLLAVLLVTLFWGSAAHALSEVQVFDFDFVIDSQSVDKSGYIQLSGMDSGFFSQFDGDLLKATLTLDMTISGTVNYSACQAACDSWGIDLMLSGEAASGDLLAVAQFTNPVSVTDTQLIMPFSQQALGMDMTLNGAFEGTGLVPVTVSAGVNFAYMEFVTVFATATGTATLMYEPVPEPSAALVFSTGFVLISSALRRRRNA